MHVEIDPYCVVGIGVVPFGSENEYIDEFRVAVECTDALNDVAIEDFKRFTRYDDLATDELWTAG